jgi:hypothetical protein
MTGAEFQGRIAETLLGLPAQLNYPEWRKLQQAIYELLSDAGDEARCEHPADMGRADGICMTCGRRPTPENTLVEGAKL